MEKYRQDDNGCLQEFIAVKLNETKTISLWMIIIFTIVVFTNMRYDFTPTFPYHQMLEKYPENIRFTGHFDGINYLRIVEKGYPKEGGEVAFFPLYPSLIMALSSMGINSLYVAVIISIGSLYLSAILLDKLYGKYSMKTLLLILSFPTSFYLIAAYTESIFILLTLLFFILMKRKKWWIAAIIALLASSTRLVGSIFGPILAISYLKEMNFNLKNPDIKSLIKALLLALFSNIGLLAFMNYLNTLLSDPLAFIHVQPQFNMGRSGGEIILLPQVIYRYVNMIFTADPSSTIYIRIIWELLTFFGISYFTLLYWKKMSISERVFVSWAILLPTFSGTLVSLPRYIIVAIPLFHQISKNLHPNSYNKLIMINILILIINIIAFTRGFFVA